MIVIATNNGVEYLAHCLYRMQRLGVKRPVTVVDTFSSDLEFRKYAQEIAQSYGAGFLQCEQPRYDFGAYLLAYDSFPDEDNFFFMHDSLWLKDASYFDIVEKNLRNFDMIGWHFFAKWGSSFDNEEQRLWLVENFGSDDYDYGFYGPNIAMKRSTMTSLMPELSKVVVDDKIKQQAMERGWAILAKKYNLPVMFLENYKGDVKSDAYRFFVKAAHKLGPRQ